MKASEGFKLYSCNSIQKCRSAFHLEYSFDCIFHVEMKDSINSGQNINLEEIVLKCILFVGIWGRGGIFKPIFASLFFTLSLSSLKSIPVCKHCIMI